MKKKYLIIIGIVIAALLLIGILFLLLGINKNKAISPKGRKPKINIEECQKLIPGLWQSGEHVYYRFNEDGTGHTWDTEDDISESEASPFQWKTTNDSNFIISYQLRIRGFIPRMYQIDRLNEDIFQFHDLYSSHTLKRLNK